MPRASKQTKNGVEFKGWTPFRASVLPESRPPVHEIKIPNQDDVVQPPNWQVMLDINAAVERSSP